VLGPIRRLPLEAAVEVALPVTIVFFAFGSSSEGVLLRIGGPGRWVALGLLGALAFAVVVARDAVLPVSSAWLLALGLAVLAFESAAWSVDARLTLERGATLTVLFLAAFVLAREPIVVLRAVLWGAAIVAVLSLVVLAVDRHVAVLPATAGAGWRFRGVGTNPNTVPMLLAVALPLALWATLAWRPPLRWLGGALFLLFAGEIAVSDSRGAIVAGFGGAVVTALVVAHTARARVALVAGLAALAVACVVVGRLPQPLAEPTAATAAPAPVAKTRGVDAEQVFRLEDELGFPFRGAYRPPVPRTLLGSSGRAQAWKGSLEQSARRPVAGYGFGTENEVFVDRFYGFDGDFVENTYVGLFLQLGVAGLAVFAALLLSLARAFARARRNSAAAAAGGTLVAAVLTGMTQTGLLSVGNIAAVAIWTCVLTLPVFAHQAAS
jgi:O-antigen ligase